MGLVPILAPAPLTQPASRLVSCSHQGQPPAVLTPQPMAAHGGAGTHRVALCPGSAVLGTATAALVTVAVTHTDVGAERGLGAGHVEHCSSPRYTVSLGTSMLVVSRRTPSHLTRGSGGIFLSCFS